MRLPIAEVGLGHVTRGTALAGHLRERTIENLRTPPGRLRCFFAKRAVFFDRWIREKFKFQHVGNQPVQQQRIGLGAVELIHNHVSCELAKRCKPTIATIRSCEADAPQIWNVERIEVTVVRVRSEETIRHVHAPSPRGKPWNDKVRIRNTLVVTRIACDRECTGRLTENVATVKRHVPHSDQRCLALIHSAGRHAKNLPRPRNLLVDVIARRQSYGKRCFGVERLTRDRPGGQPAPRHGDKIGAKVILDVCQNKIARPTEIIAVGCDETVSQESGGTQSARHLKPRSTETAEPLRIGCPHSHLKRTPHAVSLSQLFHRHRVVVKIVSRTFNVVTRQSGHRLGQLLEYLCRRFLPRHRLDFSALVHRACCLGDDAARLRKERVGSLGIHHPPIVGDRLQVGSYLPPRDRVQVQDKLRSAIGRSHGMQLLGRDDVSQSGAVSDN